ncbi:uncharacterized protein TNCV_1622711 [Trichonephila clavipes]|nr:uncharacterized protein TNCV_1622711 [Trichonephila clavipes]
MLQSKQELTTTTTTTEQPTTTTTEQPTTTTEQPTTTTTETPTTTTTEQPTTTTTEQPTTTTTEQPTTTTTEQPTTTTTEQPTTTTTEKPTTTTTEQPTTTEEPTTTTTEQSTTTEEPTTTTTDQPTTTTTEQTTTEEMSTTTTEEETTATVADRTRETMDYERPTVPTMPTIPSVPTIPTIIPTIPPINRGYKCTTGNTMMGLQPKEYFFDGKEMNQVICIPLPQSIYTGKIYERSFKGKETGQCDKDGGIIEFSIALREKVLEGFRLFCQKIKDDDVESGSIAKSSAAGTKAVCGDNYAIAGFEVQLKKPHLVNLICQKYKAPGLGSNPLG